MHFSLQSACQSSPGRHQIVAVGRSSSEIDSMDSAGGNRFVAHSPWTHRDTLFTFCVHFCTVLLCAASENGMVMTAYHVLHTRHSPSKLSRSPENTWN